jgi:hypothetical protein
MKTTLARFFAVFFFCASATFSRAGDFQSAVIIAGTPLPIINVPNDRFLVIRNFTQVGPTPTSRGTVMVTIGSSSAVTILTAAIVDPSTTTSPPGSLEVINNVVVAGPATVTATCPAGATCFITYRKGED